MDTGTMFITLCTFTRSTIRICKQRANHHRHTGNCQEANPPHSQAPACHRRCLPRRNQGAPRPAPRGPRRRPHRRHQGGQGGQGCRRVQEEGREGKERLDRRTRPGPEDPEQAGCKGFRTKGPGKDSLRRGFDANGMCMVWG